jgi:hypothetical protein
MSNERSSTPRQRLTPKQRVLKRFPFAQIVQRTERTPGQWPWVVFYKRPTRLTTGILGEGPTAQTAWDEAARVMERKERKRG